MPDENTGRDAPPAGGATPNAQDNTDLPQHVREMLAEKEAHIKRLNQENAERRHKLSEFEQQMQERREAELQEKENYKELAEQLKAERDELLSIKEEKEQADATLELVLESELEQLPEDKRALILDMPGTTKQKLDYLAKHRATLTIKPAPAMDEGARGDRIPPDAPPMSAAQQALVDAANRSGHKLKPETVARTAHIIAQDRARRGVRRLPERNQED